MVVRRLLPLILVIVLGNAGCGGGGVDRGALIHQCTAMVGATAAQCPSLIDSILERANRLNLDCDTAELQAYLASLLNRSTAASLASMASSTFDAAVAVADSTLRTACG